MSFSVIAGPGLNLLCTEGQPNWTSNASFSKDYLNAAVLLHELYPQKCEAAHTLYDDI